MSKVLAPLRSAPRQSAYFMALADSGAAENSWFIVCWRASEAALLFEKEVKVGCLRDDPGDTNLANCAWHGNNAGSTHPVVPWGPVAGSAVNGGEVVKRQDLSLATADAPVSSAKVRPEQVVLMRRIRRPGT